MIKCPSCGAENLIGAIFCRACGDKLDIEDLKPDDVADAVAQKQGSKIGRIIRNLIGLVIFLAVVGVGLLVALPPARPQVTDLGEREQKVAQNRYQTLLAGKRGKYTFTIDEINYLARSEFGLTTEAKTEAAAAGESSGALVAEQVWIELAGGDRVRCVLKSKLFGTIPMFSSIAGTLSADGAGGLQFTGTGYTFGRLPMPVAPLQGPIEGRFHALLNAAPDIQEKLVPGVRGVEVQAPDKVVVQR